MPSPWVHRAPLVALHLLPAKASEEPRPLRHLPGGCQQRGSEHLLWQVPNSILNMLNQIIANICKSCSKIARAKIMLRHSQFHSSPKKSRLLPQTHQIWMQPQDLPQQSLTQTHTQTHFLEEGCF